MGTRLSLTILATVATLSAGVDAIVASIKANITTVIKNSEQNKKLKDLNIFNNFIVEIY